METSIVSGEDMRFLVQQSEAELTTIMGQMTSLMKDITDLQNDTNNRVESIAKQNWFKRMWATVSGGNKATAKEIQNNTNKVVSYISEATAQLYNMNCINQQIICSLGNRINQVYMQATDVYNEQLNMKAQISEIMAVQQQTLQAMGAFAAKLNEKIESIDNFHMLVTEIQQGRYNDPNKLYSLCSILAQLDKRVMEDNRKLDILRNALAQSGIISSDSFSVKEHLQGIIAMPDSMVGVVYLELCNFRESFPANLFAEMIENYHFLSKMEKMSKNKNSLVDKLLAKYDLDPDAEFSFEDISESFIENKQQSIADINNIKMLSSGSVSVSGKVNNNVDNCDMEKAEKLYMDYQIIEALPILHKLAENGNGRAMYLLGEIYGYGGVESDDDNDWAKKGAEAGDILAKLNYGYDIKFNIDYTDDSWEEEDERANKMIADCFPLVKELAESGDAIAQNELAGMYKAGCGTEENENLAESWYLKSAQQGFFSSEWKIADVFWNKKKNASQAFEFCKSAADKGFYEAYFLLGVFYNNGFGVKENQNMAEKCLRNAAQLGHTIAKSSLGQRLYGDEEYDEAFKWLSECENLYFYSAAKYCLALCYIWGHGTDEDTDRAISILENILKEDEDYEDAVDVQELLGVLYKENEDYESSFEWYKKAADNGSAMGQREVGKCYRFGNGVKKNFAKAYDYLKKAAASDDGEAMNQLGLMFTNGEHVQQNGEKSFKWFKKSAEQDFAPGIYNLGQCYYYGSGTYEDEDYARELMEQAAEMGYESAQDFLDENF